VLIDFLIGEVLSGFAYEINSPSSRCGKSVSSHKDLLTDLEASFIPFNQDVFVPLKRCKRRCEASPPVKGALVTSRLELSSRMAEIAVGEGITRSVFSVKRADLGEEEAPYWTTLGKRESYKPRRSSDGVGAQIPYYARKDFLDCHLPEEWEIARDAEINPFKDVLVFRRMVEFLGAIPINQIN
ncbi:hypothetical protein Tco_1373286, partial [Tanacetum coccineum]